MLEKLERAEDEHGERFAPPRILKRLVAQGRLGAEGRARASIAYPQPDEGDQTDTVKLETPRRRRDRLARQPADERDLAAGDPGPGHGLGAGQGLAARSARW